MKTYKFTIEFISANNGCFVSTVKEYRSANMDQAIVGMSQYLEDNKHIQAVLSCICIGEVITVLDFLCFCYGWQGGTIHQAIAELNNKDQLSKVIKNYIDIHETGYIIDPNSAGFSTLINAVNQ